MSTHFPLKDRIPSLEQRGEVDLLDSFLSYVQEKNLALYSAQEEAILSLFDGQNVILNTPTGSGKSLVATALHFHALAHGRKSVYTSPIKALVNEKFLSLCREFGPENVGISTGDTTVNLQAPILCCTAEILASQALREGGDCSLKDVVIDEFHYYADDERGVAWQVPLLTLTNSRFLLMSATMSPTAFFAEKLTELNGLETHVVSSSERPVPLEFTYAETSIDVTVQELLEAQRAPIYLVHFTRNDAAESAQNLMSLNLCRADEKEKIKAFLQGKSFNSPYGRDFKKYLLHGIGIHHSGLLPKYRVLVEQMAQKGLLKLISGTDTLGVGVNVPIRTVLLTRLSKYNGKKNALLNARDFHQIVGRAGRRGYDDVGYVVALAPEHDIENRKLEAKAAGDPKKLKKLVKKKPPEGFVGWSEVTFQKLQKAASEPLSSKFRVSHGMLLQVLGREGDGCDAMRRLIASSHDTPAQKKKNFRLAWQLFRSLLDRKIVEIRPKNESVSSSKLRLNVALQDDFSLHESLSLYLLDAMEVLDRESPTYAAEILTLCEAIMENPDTILRRQLSKVKDEAMAAMRAEGIEYEERIARLEELTWPKPNADFLYQTFNHFVAHHPWVGGDLIRPKSIAREMYENFRSFSNYIKDYGLQRVEGELLRHLSGVWKLLAHTVPDHAKTEEVQEMEAWLAGMVRGTDSSLLNEWELLKNPDFIPVPELEEDADTSRHAGDLTQNKREFQALIRRAIFQWMQAIARNQRQEALDLLENAKSEWPMERFETALETYLSEHARLRLDPESRSPHHTHWLTSEDPESLLVSQTWCDPDEFNDWEAVFRLPLAACREAQQPVLHLLKIGPIGREV